MGLWGLAVLIVWAGCLMPLPDLPSVPTNDKWQHFAAYFLLAASGVQLIDKAPRKGAEGLNIAFLHPKSTAGVLMELCEDPAK